MQKFLTLFARDRVRSSVRPLNAAFQKPLAGMVIRGSGPYLCTELVAPEDRLVPAIQICSIILPIQVICARRSFLRKTARPELSAP
jgi:hypothetical protein